MGNMDWNSKPIFPKQNNVRHTRDTLTMLPDPFTNPWMPQTPCQRPGSKLANGVQELANGCICRNMVGQLSDALSNNNDGLLHLAMRDKVWCMPAHRQL